MTVLVLIDAQRNMLLPPDPVPDADRVTALLKDLLERGRVAGVPVVHMRNNGGDDDPDRPGTTGWSSMPTRARRWSTSTSPTHSPAPTSPT
jgi:nicotinamidase-related amidase